MGIPCLGRTGRGRKEEVLPCIKILCMHSDIQYKAGGRPVERLWVDVREKSSRDDVTLVICYGTLNLEEEMDKPLFKQLTEASK